jgi:hypothetical protein
MKKIALVTAVLLALVAVTPTARADTVGAVIGATTGLFIAGPPGAIIGAIIGGIYGRPFWGPPISSRSCWIDNSFHRHCRGSNGY